MSCPYSKIKCINFMYLGAGPSSPRYASSEDRYTLCYLGQLFNDVCLCLCCTHIINMQLYKYYYLSLSIKTN